MHKGTRIEDHWAQNRPQSATDSFVLKKMEYCENHHPNYQQRDDRQPEAGADEGGDQPEGAADDLGDKVDQRGDGGEHAWSCFSARTS